MTLWHWQFAEPIQDVSMQFLKTGQARMLGYITDTIDVQIPHQCARNCLRTSGCRFVLIYNTSFWSYFPVFEIVCRTISPEAKKVMNGQTFYKKKPLSFTSRLIIDAGKYTPRLMLITLSFVWLQKYICIIIHLLNIYIVIAALSTWKPCQ